MWSAARSETMMNSSDCLRSISITSSPLANTLPAASFDIRETSETLARIAPLISSPRPWASAAARSNALSSSST